MYACILLQVQNFSIIHNNLGMGPGKENYVLENNRWLFITILVCKGLVGFVPTFVGIDVWFLFRDFEIDTLVGKSSNSRLVSIAMNSSHIHHILLAISNWVGWSYWVFVSCCIGDKKTITV
jgi:hypothetical protein